jgi:hypothetical protein
LVLAAALLWKWRRPGGTSFYLVAAWLLIPVLGFYLVTLLRPMYTARYLIFVLPAYLLLLSAGLAVLASKSRLLAALLLVGLLAANGWGVWLQARTPLKADFRAATGYLRRRLAADDLILFQIPHGRYSFDYYYRSGSASPSPLEGPYRVLLPSVVSGDRGAYRWAAGLYTNGGMEVGEVDQRMAEITAGSEVVWLVATEVPLWDERGLVQAWLGDHALRMEEVSFVRVTVHRYVLH